MLGAATDIDGRFRIIGIPAGTYVLVASYAGAPTEHVLNVRVSDGSDAVVPLTMTFPDVSQVLVCGYESPFFTNDAIGQSRVLAGWEIENMPINR